MNCTEFREHIQDLARDEAPTDAPVAEALEHAESCRACDVMLREAEKLTASLHKLAAQHRFDSASPRTETALMDAFRQHHAPAQPLRRTGSWMVASTVGIAATIVFGLLLTGYRPDFTRNQAPDPNQTPSASPRQNERNLASPRSTLADLGVDEETGDQTANSYIPVAAGFDPEFFEGGAVVRVVLSRPALESMGVSVTTPSNQQMLADMIVSYDGTPQAVRIVDWEDSDVQ